MFIVIIFFIRKSFTYILYVTYFIALLNFFFILESFEILKKIISKDAITIQVTCRKKIIIQIDKTTALKDIKLKEIKFYDKSLDNTECHTRKEGKKKKWE